MLENTFIHLPGISFAKELELWKGGIITWDDFLKLDRTFQLNNLDKLKKEIKNSIRSLKFRDCNYFKEKIPKNQHWRCFSNFRDKVAYLDIETTGLSKESDITIIGIYDKVGEHIFINGKNLDQFSSFVEKYDLLITYNGACFDLPFIRRKFGIKMDHMHIDLRFFLKKLGLSGGLKTIEKRLGIKRSDNTQDVDGKEAVRLWYEYKKGNKKALETLIEYNIEDIKNLEKIINLTYKKVKKKYLPYF